MRYRVLLFLLSIPILVIGQKPTNRYPATVFDFHTQEPLHGVRVFNSKGELLGKTDVNGKADLTIIDFPVFLQKAGYLTQPVYTPQELQTLYLRHQVTTLSEIEVIGDTDAMAFLKRLRDKSRMNFPHKDTVLYYRFTYSLHFPDVGWNEEAQGYIRVKRPNLNPLPDSAFQPYIGAMFVQFEYTNTGTEFLKSTAFSKAKPGFLMAILYAGDLMGTGYAYWRQLLDKKNHLKRRRWDYERDAFGNLIFSHWSSKSEGQLLDQIGFDSLDNITRVTLYQPVMKDKYGPYKIFNNFSKPNAVNSFRTIYQYSKDSNNRKLESIEHLSTFYKKGKTNYRMQFTATLVDFVPEKRCEVPVAYLNTNLYYKNQKGWGIYQLINEGYTISKDAFIQQVVPEIDREINASE